MQIAQVVPKVKTQKEAVFDYAIPPEILPQIKIGILVLVPFGYRKIEGLVIALKKSSKIKQLKPIIAIIDPEPAIDTVHTELAKWMANYYLASLGKTLFENIVPPAKRILKKSAGQNYTTFPARTSKVVQIKSQKFLVIGNFQTRIKIYLQAIKKTLARNEQAIILVPDLALIPYFTSYLKNSVAIIHAGLNKTQRFLEWDKIRRGQNTIIIGSNSALFAPAKNLGLIIIDQEENETYKNRQAPRFRATSVANQLSKLTAVNLLLGSLTPRVETYYRALRGEYKIIKEPAAKKKNIILVDMNFEKKSISNSLQETVSQTLAANKKVVLVLNRKGEGIKFSCANCGWIYACPKCGLPLIPQQNKAVCHHCEKNFPLAANCPKCHSFQLKPFGLTTIKLEKFIRDLYPDKKIIRLEKPNGKNQPAAGFLSGWNIAIVTSYALKFNFPPIGLVGIMDADYGLNFPGFRAAEKNFQTLFKFLRIGERGMIQTHLTDHFLIKSLARLDFEQFFLNEIEQRKKFGFPPFARLIHLIYQHTDENQAKKTAAAVASQLKTLIKPYQNTIFLLGPSPAFLAKQRNKFRYQIILKTGRPSYPPALDDFLKTMPKGWVVDVDPDDLL